MRIDEIMAAIADRLRVIPDLNVYPYPLVSGVLPCAIVEFPETYTYDATYFRGADALKLNVGIWVPLAEPYAAATAVGYYTAGSGPCSVKAALENPGVLTPSDATLRVASVEIGQNSLNGNPAAGMIFTVNIMGKTT